MEKKNFIFSAKFILVSFILISAVFFGVFSGIKQKMADGYDASIKAAPSIMKFSADKVVEIKDLSEKYGPFAGVAVAFIFLVVAYLLYGILAAVRLGKFLFTAPLVQLILSVAILIFAYNLAFDSSHFSALTSGIVYYLGLPLYYTFMILSVLYLIMTVFSFLSKKKIVEVAKVSALLFPLSIMLTGCDVLSGTMSLACVISPDSPHCYQEAAVATNDPSKCEKVGIKKGFENLDSNPPKDKCYYMVAENQKDPSTCKNIKGGTMSYSTSECAESVVSSSEKEIKTKLESGKKLSDQEMANVQSQLDKNQKMLEMVSNMSKNMHDMNAGMIRNLK